MSNISKMSVDELREAAAAWKAYYRGRFMPLSIHDRITDLIDEIERLRTKEKESV